MKVASMAAGVLAAAENAVTLPGWFVVVMGVGIVFIGLICIVVLCSIMSKIVRLLERNTAPAAPAQTQAPAAVQAAEPIANRQELVAAISAALAEELGTDVSAIRILSLKKV